MSRCARLLVALLLVGCGEDSKPAAQPTTLAISELMYHPVGEGESDEHEFLEIENYGDKAVDLGGHRLSGGVRFAFAPRTIIAPKSFLVVANRRARLLALAHYGLRPEQVIGDYGGSLDNDGDTVRLERIEGDRARIIDEVHYEDAFPWPLAADALGANEGWLPPETLPLSAHQFLGRSLERRSPTADGRAPTSWVISPLDGATPGRPRAERGATLATVVRLELESGGKRGTVLTRDQPVSVRVQITPAASAPAIEYFVDEFDKEDEPRAKVALAANGTDLVAQLPAFPAGTLLRLRVIEDRGRGTEALAPRPEDPRAFLPAFVDAPVAGTTPIYHLLISKARWERLYDNVFDGRVPANVIGGNPTQCEINPRWDLREPAVFIAGGAVYDIQARYQGSRTNRTNGPRPLDPSKWPQGPNIAAFPGVPLSWHFNFPRYARFEGKRSINLNKLTDAACQGFLTRAGNILFESVGVPAATSSYARLYINGRYYHYMQRLEHMDEEMLERSLGKDTPIGDLFKSQGTRWDEGPWGFGDESPLQPYCGYSVDERYAATYERQTFEDTRPGSGIVRALIEDLHAARAAGPAAVRAHFERHWDVELLTNYMVVRNWLGAWDDVWQNHYLYRKPDGRWMVLPTDMDNHFGFSPPSAVDASFFAGAANGRSNFRDLSNDLKDSYLRVFREEYLARLRALSETVLHPSNVMAIIDEVAQDYVLEEARAAPAGVSNQAICGMGDPAPVIARMKAFARGRYERVQDGLVD